MNDFEREVTDRIRAMASNSALAEAAKAFMQESIAAKYSYNFSWMGRPVIQYPQDMMAMQELIWRVKPDLIIETGIAHGGSLIFSASMLALLDLCETVQAGKAMVAGQSERRVLGIDVDIRAHNRQAIDAHPLSSRIQMIQSSSVDPATVSDVHAIAKGYSRVLVCLDSNHTHAHVFAELEAYALLATVGSYCVVFDTVVEDLPKALSGERPWGPGDNPKTAVWQFLKMHKEFEIDKSIPDQLQITVAPDGFLKRVR